MTAKQEYALNKVITALPDDCRGAFREVAECAMSLGYMPVIRGKREDYADFIKSKLKRTILKIGTNPKFPPCLYLFIYEVLRNPYLLRDFSKGDC